MGNRFRTSTPMGDWRSFKFTHAEQAVIWYEGKLYKINDTVGMLFLDVQYDADGCKKEAKLEYGEEGVLVYHIEKVIVDKVHTTGDAFQVGDKVFWSGVSGDPVTPHFNSSDPPMWIGICTEPAGQLDTTVEIDLKGDKATYLHVL